MTHTTIVLFGATGDLVSRKVLPALYELEIEGAPVADAIVPFTRRPLSTEEFLQQFVRPALEKVFITLDEEAYARFSKRFTYVQGDYADKSGFEELSQVLRENNSHKPKNELFYLPVHPEQLKDVVRFMKEAGVVEDPRNDTAGFERIALEKPFGESRESAEELLSSLGEIFADDEIYCLDHYLGKPMLRRIPRVMQENELLRTLLRESSLEKVHVRIFEAMGVEGRGAFYDPVGAFLDVGQNHALEMLALLLASVASSNGNKNLSREGVLRGLRTLTEGELQDKTKRAQYDTYKDIVNVKEGSNTETYFRVESEVEGEGDQVTTIVLEGGKGIGVANQKEIEMRLTAPGEKSYRVLFGLDPKEELVVEAFENGVLQSTKTTPLRDRAGIRQYTEEYKALFRAAVAKERDEKLFLSPAEVLLLWSFADPIVRGWKKELVPLSMYSKNTIPKVH